MNSLIPLPENAVVQEIDVSSLVSSKKFLPSLRFFSSKAEEVIQGKKDANSYYLFRSSSDSEKIGTELSIVPIKFEVKALDLTDKSAPVSCYTPELNDQGQITNETFKMIQEISETTQSGAMWGFELLCWLPQQKIYALWFLGNASQRRLFGDLRKAMQQHLVLNSKMVSNKKGSWITPIFRVSEETPVLPSAEETQRATDTYAEMCKESGAETIDTEAPKDKRRKR